MTTRYIGDVTNDNPSSVTVDDAQYILNWLAADGNMTNLGPLRYDVNGEFYTMVDKIDLGNVTDSDPPSVTVDDAQYILNWLAADGSMTNLGPIRYDVNGENYTIRELVPPRTINFTGATYTDYNNTPDAEGNTILEAGSTNKYSFSEGLANDIPMTVSLANANTTIQNDINLKIKEVNGGTETVLSETTTNTLNGVVGPVINFTYENDKEYVIEITSTSDQQGTYQLDVNWTRPAITTNGTFKVDIYTLDSTNVWTNGMMTELNQGLNKWDQIIIGMPGSDANRKIDLSVSIQSFNDDPALAATVIRETSNTGFTSDYYNQYTTKASIRFNSNEYADHWNNPDGNNSHELKDITIHELGHVLGIGTFWQDDTQHNKANLFVNDRVPFTDKINGQQYVLYKGANALQVYKHDSSVDFRVGDTSTKYTMSNKTVGGIEYDPAKFAGIPLENSGPTTGLSPAAGYHLEEGEDDNAPSTNVITLNAGDGNGDVNYLGLGEEVMTAYLEGFTFSQQLSAISVGLVNDLGYNVDWSGTDAYDISLAASEWGNLKSDTIKVTVEN